MFPSLDFTVVSVLLSVATDQFNRSSLGRSADQRPHWFNQPSAKTEHREKLLVCLCPKKIKSIRINANIVFPLLIPHRNTMSYLLV